MPSSLGGASPSMAEDYHVAAVILGMRTDKDRDVCPVSRIASTSCRNSSSSSPIRSATNEPSTQIGIELDDRLALEQPLDFSAQFIERLHHRS